MLENSRGNVLKSLPWKLPWLNCHFSRVYYSVATFKPVLESKQIREAKTGTLEPIKVTKHEATELVSGSVPL